MEMHHKSDEKEFELHSHILSDNLLQNWVLIHRQNLHPANMAEPSKSHLGFVAAALKLPAI